MKELKFVETVDAVLKNGYVGLFLIALIILLIIAYILGKWICTYFCSENRKKRLLINIASGKKKFDYCDNDFTFLKNRGYICDGNEVRLTPEGLTYLNIITQNKSNNTTIYLSILMMLVSIGAVYVSFKNFQLYVMELLK